MGGRRQAVAIRYTVVQAVIVAYFRVVLVEVVNIFVKNFDEQRYMRRAGLDTKIRDLQTLLQALQNAATVPILNLWSTTHERS